MKIRMHILNMESSNETNLNTEQPIEIPDFINKLSDFTKVLDDTVKIEDLFNPPHGPKNPPANWPETVNSLEPSQKAILNTTLGAARANGFNELNVLNNLEVSDIIKLGAKYAATNPNFRLLGLKRAHILYKLFHKTDTVVHQPEN